MISKFVLKRNHWSKENEFNAYLQKVRWHINVRLIRVH